MLCRGVLGDHSWWTLLEFSEFCSICLNGVTVLHVVVSVLHVGLVEGALQIETDSVELICPNGNMTYFVRNKSYIYI